MELNRVRSAGRRPPRPQGVKPLLHGEILGRPILGPPISKASALVRNARSQSPYKVRDRETRQAAVRSKSNVPAPLQQIPNERFKSQPSVLRVQSAFVEPMNSPAPEPEFMFSPSKRLKDMQQAINLPPEQAALMSEELKDWYFSVAPSKTVSKEMTPEVPGVFPAMSGCSLASSESAGPKREEVIAVPMLPTHDRRFKDVYSESSKPNSSRESGCQRQKTSRPSSQENGGARIGMRVQQPSAKEDASMKSARERKEVEELLFQIRRRSLENPEMKMTLRHLVGISGHLIPSLNDHITQLRQQHDVCGQEERKKIEEIINVLCPGKRYMNIKDFEHLHDVIKSIVAPQGVAAPGRLGSMLSWKADEDFKQMACSGNEGRAEVPEVCIWLHKLYTAAQEDFSPWIQKEFSHVLDTVVLRCKARNEVHKYELTSGLMLTMAQYGEAFRDLRKATKGSIEIENEGEAEPLQAETIKCFEDLYAQGKEHFHMVEDFGEEVKTAVGAQFWAMGPLKEYKRGQEKIDSDYGGNARRLVDVVRFSVICNDLDMARQAIETIRHHREWDIVRVKSAFTKNARIGPTGGYRDVKVNARHKKHGLIIEIQLHILVFYMIKREGGHKTYEWTRKFSIGGITSAEDVLGEVSFELLSHMMEIAEAELQGAINAKILRKEVKKRMTLFECARLARAVDTINEQGYKLLEYIGEHKAGSFISQDDCKITDRMIKRDVMLKVAKAPKFNIDREHRVQLLRKAMQSVMEADEDWISTADKLFLAECKFAMALTDWNTNQWGAVIENLDKAIELFADPHGCGLGHNHPAVARARMYLGSALVATNRPRAGIEHLCTAEASLVRWYGELDHRASDVFLELSTAWKAESAQPQLSRTHRTEALQESLWHLERCLCARRSCFGEVDMRVGNVYLHMADVRETRGDRTGAMADFAKCMEVWEISGKLQKKYLHTEAEQEMYGRLLAVKIEFDRA